MNKHCSSAVTGQTKSKCTLSEEIISGFHFITEVQSWVQTPDLAEQSSALGNLPESSSHARAAIYVRPARLCSICSQVRPKPPRVNPRNACTWCRISHERLSKSNHALTQQTTHMWVTAQHRTKHPSGHTPKARDPTPDRCSVWRGWSPKSCWSHRLLCRRSYQRQEIKTAGSKTKRLTRSKRKAVGFRKWEQPDKTKNWCRPRTDA